MTELDERGVDVSTRAPGDAEAVSGADRLDTPLVLHAIAAIAAVGAVFASAAPTGTTWWDGILRAGLAYVFVLAAGRAPGWVTIVAATVAPAFIGSSGWLAPLAVGLMLAIGAAVFRWPKIAAAAAGALAIQGLLRLPAIGFFGLPSLIAGAAIALVLLGGFGAASPTARKRIALSVVALGLVTAAAGVVGGLVLLGARQDVEDGIEAARDGLDAARDGEPEAVVAELEAASALLTTARDQATSPLAQPLSLIPIAAQHHRAVTTATRLGSEIADQAAKATIDADISSITLTAGAVDLSALSAMEDDLATTVQLLVEGIRELEGQRSGWIVPPVADRMQDLSDEMRTVLPEAQIAAEAARVLPAMLGQDGPRRYFVAFGSPAESRELGGFIGSWVLLEVDEGRVRQVEGGRARDLYDLSRSNGPLDPQEFPRLYAEGWDPDEWPQNLGSSPDLDTVAAAARQLFDGLGGGPIDGFVYLDGYALAALLEITGPVEVDSLEQPLTAATGESFFFDEQYRLTERDELKSELGEIFSSVFDGLLDTRLPGPERLGRVLGPSARQGRLQVATFDDDENAFLELVKLRRDFAFDASSDTVDTLAVVQSNLTQSKLDLYLQRDVSYDITVDEAGSVTGTITVELVSNVPDDAPEYALGTNAPGTSGLSISIYSPHDVSEVRLDGTPRTAQIFYEYGLSQTGTTVLLPPNESRTLEFDFTGTVDPDRPYELALWHQPLVNTDSVSVVFTASDGSTTERSVDLTENAVFTFVED